MISPRKTMDVNLPSPQWTLEQKLLVTENHPVYVNLTRLVENPISYILFKNQSQDSDTANSIIVQLGEQISRSEKDENRRTAGKLVGIKVEDYIWRDETNRGTPVKDTLFNLEQYEKSYCDSINDHAACCESDGKCQAKCSYRVLHMQW